MSYDYGFPLLKYLCWNDIILNVLSKKYKNTCFYGYFHNNKKASQKKGSRSIKYDQVNMSNCCTIFSKIQILPFLGSLFLSKTHREIEFL